MFERFTDTARKTVVTAGVDRSVIIDAIGKLSQLLG